MKPLGKMDVFGLSIPGSAHLENQDRFAAADLSKSLLVRQTNLEADDDTRVNGSNQGQVFLVADGIGTGEHTAQASLSAVESVFHYLLNEMPWYHLADGRPEDVVAALEDAMRQAQDDLRAIQGDRRGAGSTLTLAFVSWPDLFVAHVGSSGCYLRHAGSTQRLTHGPEAHDLGWMSRVLRAIQPEGERGSKPTHAHRLGGYDDELCLEVHHHRLQAGDVLALVTDGVTDPLGDEHIARILDSGLDSEGMCGELVAESNGDDRTALVVRFLSQTQVRSLRSGSPSPRLAVGLPWRGIPTPPAGGPVPVAMEKKPDPRPRPSTPDRPGRPDPAPNKRPSAPPEVVPPSPAPPPSRRGPHALQAGAPRASTAIPSAWIDA